MITDPEGRAAVMNVVDMVTQGLDDGAKVYLQRLDVTALAELREAVADVRALIVEVLEERREHT